MKYDVVIIGGGPGGYVCAIRCGQLGLKTALIEKDNVGGVCLNVGCIPSKAIIHAASLYHKIQHEAPSIGISVGKPTCDFAQMQAWKRGVVKKLTGGVSQLLKANNVEVIKGRAEFVDAKTLKIHDSTVKGLESSHFVIATGSSNLALPNLPLNGKTVISSTEALDLEHLPKKMVVIGGGFIGLEIGMAYAKLGSEVTIIEATPQILPTVDADLVDVVVRKAKKMGIQILTNTLAKGFKGDASANASSVTLQLESKGEAPESVTANVVLVAVGRKPNSQGMGLEAAGVKTDTRGNIVTDKRGRTNVVGIYAIGDVNGAPQLAHRASMDGLLAAADIKGENGFRDYRTVPWAVFCDPEIGVVGLTEKEAKEQGIPVKVGKFPFAALGKAICTNEAEGFIKVLINEKDESIVGVHIVGPEASNQIAEAALAIEMGAVAEDVVRTIHTHPTLPEAFPEAVEHAFLKAIHTGNRPSRKPSI